MTDTTQPHPEPSEEASSLPVVAWLHKLLTESYRETSITSFSEDDPWQDALKEVGHAVISDPLVRLSDAQSRLNAMRVELERKSDAIQKLWKERDEARAELAALKSDMADMLESVTRESLAGDKARAELAAALQGRCRITIPTETMEQEFQSHYRRGYVAALKAAQVAPAAGGVVEWQSIETAPKDGRTMFVVRAFNVTNKNCHVFNYTSDPYCVWTGDEGDWVRWPHPFPPTHWLALPQAAQKEGE